MVENSHACENDEGISLEIINFSIDLEIVSYDFIIDFTINCDIFPYA